MDVLIVTDNENAAIHCKELIEEFAGDVEEIHIALSFKEGLKWLRKNDSPEIIFLWDSVDSKSGIEFLEKSSTDAAIVFVAKNAKNALEVFAYNALDFHVSPLTEEKVDRTFEKYTKYFKKQSEVGYMKDLQSLVMTMARKDKEYKKRFMVKVGNTIRSVSVKDIAYFFAQERIIFLVQKDGKKLPMDNTLDEIEGMVDPAAFFRANRQFIVNINAISEIHPYFKGRVKINLNPLQENDIVISSEKSRSFKEWLGE